MKLYLKILFTLIVILFIALVIFWQVKLPKERVIVYYNTICTRFAGNNCDSSGPMPKTLSKKDKEFITQIERSLTQKKFVFVYPDPEDANRIVVEYLTLKPAFGLDGIYPWPLFWDIVDYDSSFVYLNLERQEAARQRVFDEIKK